MNSPPVGVTTISESKMSADGSGGSEPVHEAKLPIGKGVAAVAFVVSPSSAFGPLKLQLPSTNVLPSGPVLSFRYAQPSAYSQGCPVPSVLMSPNTSITAPDCNSSIA